MSRLRASTLAGLAGAFALALAASAPVSASAATVQTYHTALTSLNDSGASGVANLQLRGDQLTVTINAHGLLPGTFHAQHLHYDATAAHTCPPADLASPLTVADGVPYYGVIDISLTTSGSTAASAGLTGPFPVADSSGDLHYRRTITLTPEQATHVSDFVVVQHGVDSNRDGVYDGPIGFGGVPQEITLPADCGAVGAANGS